MWDASGPRLPRSQQESRVFIFGVHHHCFDIVSLGKEKGPGGDWAPPFLIYTAWLTELFQLVIFLFFHALYIC